MCRLRTTGTKYKKETALQQRMTKISMPKPTLRRGQGQIQGKVHRMQFIHLGSPHHLVPPSAVPPPPLAPASYAPGIGCFVGAGGGAGIDIGSSSYP